MKDPVSLKNKLAYMGYNNVNCTNLKSSMRSEVIGMQIIKIQIYLLIKQNISSLLEIIFSQSVGLVINCQLHSGETQT